MSAKDDAFELIGLLVGTGVMWAIVAACMLLPVLPIAFLMWLAWLLFW